MKNKLCDFCVFLSAVTLAFGQSNGIVVGRPKVYEDEALRQMLQNAEAALARTQFIDQAGIAARIGSTAGTTVRQNAFGFSVNGPALPQIQTVANAPVTNTTQTNSTGSEVDAGTATTTKSTQSNVTGVTSNGATEQTTITRAAATPAAPVLAPASILAPPSAFSPSSSNILNEQMQLTYETANLRLLLEGSLNDRYTFLSGSRVAKRRTTLGFPISVNTSSRYKKAVAEIEIRVRGLPGSEAPTIVAVLPRERTFNVASITDSSISIGGGIVTQVFSAGGTFLHGKKSYYIVQDQDTVAVQFPEASESERAATFGWQFRPVLGKEAVSSGLRQVFVQLSFSALQNASCLGAIEVLTRWRKYDAKSGVLGVPVDETVAMRSIVPAFDLIPSDYQVAWEDLGNGQVAVTLSGDPGWVMPGTRVRLGDTILGEVSPAFLLENSTLRFLAPAALLARSPAKLVTRDGTETDITYPSVRFTPSRVACAQLLNSPISDTTAPVRVSLRQSQATPALQNVGFASREDDGKAAVPSAGHQPAAELVLRPPDQEITILDVIPETFDATQTLVRIKLRKDPDWDKFPLVATLGSQIFGLKDSPFRGRKEREISLLVPTASLRAAGHLGVRRLFWGERYAADFALRMENDFNVSGITLVTKTADSSTFVIAGSQIDGVRVSAPAGVDLRPIRGSNTTALFTLKNADLPSVKQLVLQKVGGQPVLVAMPKTDPPKPSLKDHDPVEVGKGLIVTLTGALLDGLNRVVAEDGTRIYFKTAPDGKSVTLNLPDALTAEPGVLTLTFRFDDNTVLHFDLGVSRS